MPRVAKRGGLRVKGCPILTGASSPPKKRREDMMEPIQLTRSEEPPTSSWKATKKIPKVFSIPITRTLT